MPKHPDPAPAQALRIWSIPKKPPAPSVKRRLKHALAGVKGVLNLIPAVGGALASLVGDYVPTSTQQSMVKTTELLREKLTRQEDRIDINAVIKEDFAELFKSCYLIIIRSNREEKLRAAAALLANLLLRPGDPNKASYEELDHLVRCLDAWSIGALTVLGAARRLVATGPAGGYLHFTQLREVFPQFDASLLMSLVSELRSLNLLSVQEGSIRMADHDELLIDLTSIGRRFAERFLEGTAEA
jgi:hypothetical protein